MQKPWYAPLRAWFTWLFAIQHPDPVHVRRGRLSSYILATAFVAVVLTILSIVTAPPQTATSFIIIEVGLVLVIPGLFWLNRFRPQWAAIAFLVPLTLVLAISDDPAQIIGGRSTMALVVPITVASVTLTPWAAFVFAGLEIGLLFILAGPANMFFGAVVSSTILFAIALVSWLGANGLEKALADLSAINRELDQRVAERTRDLAERSQDLAEALAQEKAMLGSIADGVIVFDPKGAIITSNPAVAFLLDIPPAQLRAMHMSDLIQARLSPAEQEKFTELLHHPTPSHVRLNWDKKALSVSFAPVHSTPERLLGTVTVFRDFTREAELERLKAAFVGIVSHELRTPLGAILGYGEILNEGLHGPLNDKQQQMVMRIRTNTQKLLRMVSDLLDQAQIESGRLALKIAPFATTELIDGVNAIMQPIAQEKGLAFNLDLTPDFPQTLVGDMYRLNQIIVNLSNNAVKFTDTGSITVRLSQPDATHWVCEVADTGRGIPPEAQQFVFEAFRQVDAFETRKTGGVGLGLSIVKSLVEQMNGQITLHSAVGQGTTFTVILPLETAPAAAK